MIKLEKWRNSYNLSTGKMCWFHNMEGRLKDGGGGRNKEKVEFEVRVRRDQEQWE